MSQVEGRRGVDALKDFELLVGLFCFQHAQRLHTRNFVGYKSSQQIALIFPTVFKVSLTKITTGNVNYNFQVLICQ